MAWMAWVDVRRIDHRCGARRERVHAVSDAVKLVAQHLDFSREFAILLFELVDKVDS